MFNFFLKTATIGNITDDFDVSLKCGANYCPSTDLNANQIAESSTVDLLMGIYLGSGLLAILVIFIFLDKIDLEGEAKNEGTCTLFISTLTFLRNRKMQLLIPITIFSGLEQGFVFGDFSKVRQNGYWLQLEIQGVFRNKNGSYLPLFVKILLIL